MTTYRKVRKRDHGRHNPIFPICGQPGDARGNTWTPHSIKRHESSCRRCQVLGEMSQSVRQSEYRTNTKKRASLAQFFVGLPFELDEGLYDEDLEDFNRELAEGAELDEG